MAFRLKWLLFLAFMAVSASAELEDRRSFKNQALFERSFRFNPEVENWTNVFFAELFKKELSSLEIRFSEETDMSFGFIEGDFSSSLQTKEHSSLWEGDFVFYVDPSDGKQSEYGFHFETEFEIKPTSALFDFIQKDLALCKKESPSLFLSFCRIFQIKNFNSKTDKLPHITENLYRWKENLIRRLYEIEDPEILAIQTEFVNWIADQILIEEFSNRVVLHIDLSGLKAEFEDEAQNFFRSTQLTDYSLESLRLEAREDQILARFHLKKLHVAKRARLYIELASLLQDFIEDEERGIGLAQSLREALSLRHLSKMEMLSHIKSKELINLGWTVGSSLIRGEESSEKETAPAPADLEEELGLD